MERDWLSPIGDEPYEAKTLNLRQIEAKSYVGGLVKSFKRGRRKSATASVGYFFPVRSRATGGLPARLEPQQFCGSQVQADSFSVLDRKRGIPAGVAAAYQRLATLAIKREYPLFAERILKVADVNIGIVIADDWRIAARTCMTILNAKEWFRHQNTVAVSVVFRPLRRIPDGEPQRYTALDNIAFRRPCCDPVACVRCGEAGPTNDENFGSI